MADANVFAITAIPIRPFNDAVTRYNTKRETFPTNIIAGIFGFEAAELFEIKRAEERENVKVSF